MQRNSNLAKEILEIIIAEDSAGGGLYREEIHGVFAERHGDHGSGRDEYVEYHLLILESGGFVKRTKDNGDRNQDNFELTWAGHDFVEFGLAN